MKFHITSSNRPLTPTPIVERLASCSSLFHRPIMPVGAWMRHMADQRLPSQPQSISDHWPVPSYHHHHRHHHRHGLVTHKGSINKTKNYKWVGPRTKGLNVRRPRRTALTLVKRCRFAPTAMDIASVIKYRIHIKLTVTVEMRHWIFNKKLIKFHKSSKFSKIGFWNFRWNFLLKLIRGIKVLKTFKQLAE